jgi:hypothetical protein
MRRALAATAKTEAIARGDGSDHEHTHDGPKASGVGATEGRREGARVQRRVGEIPVQSEIRRVAEMAMTEGQESQSKRLALLARKYRAALVAEESLRKHYEEARDYAARIRQEMYDAADRYWEDVSDE